MVELALPKNSRMQEGKTWPVLMAYPCHGIPHLSLWSPDDDENPRIIDTYYVDRDDCGPMVLDGLLYIKKQDRPDADAAPFVP